MDQEREAVAAWMRRQMDRLGWTPQRWATEADMAPTNITRALNPNQKPVATLKTLDALAKAAGVPSVLDFLNGLLDLPPQKLALPKPSNDIETATITRLDLSLALGPGTNIDDYIENDGIEFDLGWLRTFTRAPANKLRMADGAGDSMFPTIHDRDQLIFDTTQRELTVQDRIWAISLFGAGALKRLRRVGKGRVLVISDNPDVPDQEVDESDVRIQGRLVASIRRH